MRKPKFHENRHEMNWEKKEKFTRSVNIIIARHLREFVNNKDSTAFHARKYYTQANKAYTHERKIKTRVSEHTAGLF